jgi:ABC-type transport system involved in cytochrome c biogenesis permease subunit
LGIRSFETKIIVGSAAQEKKQSAIGQPRSEMSGVFHGEGIGQNVPTKSRDTSGRAWRKQARNAVLDRKLFIAITAGIVLITGLIAIWNRAEFNPDIRPIMAVLRSNFWLAIHVIAIIVSYAAAFAAWGMAVVSLGYTIFGRYRRTEAEFEGQKAQVHLPEACQLYSLVIERLIKIALLLLIVGTVLGARWADYSWGRFWSWDPKEVWALITIMFYVIVFHGKADRYYGAIGITAGALFASIAVIVTWYGVNFVFKGSVHAYGGGTESIATFFLITFITANIVLGALALLRYNAEVYGNEADESPVQS